MRQKLHNSSVTSGSGTCFQGGRSGDLSIGAKNPKSHSDSLWFRAPKERESAHKPCAPVEERRAHSRPHVRVRDTGRFPATPPVSQTDAAKNHFWRSVHGGALFLRALCTGFSADGESTVGVFALVLRRRGAKVPCFVWWWGWWGHGDVTVFALRRP